MRYAIIIEKAGENSCAHNPDVPGCVATGDTADELRKRFPETLRRHIQAVLAAGGELPQPTTQAEMIEVGDVA